MSIESDIRRSKERGGRFPTDPQAPLDPEDILTKETMERIRRAEDERFIAGVHEGQRRFVSEGWGVEKELKTGMSLDEVRELKDRLKTEGLIPGVPAHPAHVSVPTDELPRRVPRDPESVRNEQEVRRAAAALKPQIEELRTAYEYRVTKPNKGGHFREVCGGGTAVFRSDDELWANWSHDEEFPGLSGVEGIAEATRREQVADGFADVRVERRVVGPWEVVSPK